MEKSILSLAEAAALVGVTKSAIVQAVGRERLRRRPDQNFDATAVYEFMRGRGVPHSTGRRPRSVKQNTAAGEQRGAADERQIVAHSALPPAPAVPPVFIPLTDALPGAPAWGVPEAICMMLGAVREGGFQLAHILLRNQPEAAAREALAAWEAAMLDTIVGPALPNWADEEEWPPPPYGGAWRTHLLFAEPIAMEHDCDWQEAGALAATWRAERGRPAP